jgi:hypothetical protein
MAGSGKGDPEATVDVPHFEAIALGIVRTLPRLEAWLDDHADSWAPLADRDYKTLVRRWSSLFGPLIDADLAVFKGSRAISSLESRLPGDVILFSGVRVPGLSNNGGLGAAAYRAVGLRALSSELANQLALIALSVDFSWCCVFSHEAGSWVWEQMYQREPSDNPGL